MSKSTNKMGGLFCGALGITLALVNLLSVKYAADWYITVGWIIAFLLSTCFHKQIGTRSINTMLVISIVVLSIRMGTNYLDSVNTNEYFVWILIGTWVLAEGIEDLLNDSRRFKSFRFYRS